MVWDAAVQFFHKKTSADTIPLSEALLWVASGELERFFLAWRRDMYLHMMHLAKVDTETDLAFAVMMSDPPLFGFNYALYKAMTSGGELSDWTIPRLDQLKLDL